MRQVLISYGWYNNVPQTGWLNQRIYCLTFLKDYKSEIKVSAGLVSVEDYEGESVLYLLPSFW